MENKGLCVDYESLDDCIAELDAVYSNQQKVYNKIKNLQNYFWISQGDVTESLKDALDTYEEIYGVIMELCGNAAEVLRKAKLAYADIDRQIGEAISEES
ncbi:MAG: hypothetical protein PUA59_08830 [Clostridium sp.]|nr:hypothetical protein [Clostridium sp.]